MGVLSELQPQKVFHFFEEICNIPHGSGNVDRISDYLVKFAKDRALEVYQDELKNVVIIKEATQGYEAQPPVIIQGHMDMVAVQTPECTLNMKEDGLELMVEGDLVSAKGTSLGGDDGIAVAYALAVLDAKELSHPRIEAVITVDEEVGMDGARGIDLSMLKGRRLLNIDSEEEGIFTVGCAGGARVDCRWSGKAKVTCGNLLLLKVCGLQGGHSGVEIHHERGNSNCIMGRVLAGLSRTAKVHLVSLKGGLADNAIPRETCAEVLVADTACDQDALVAYLEQVEKNIKEELTTRDPGFRLEWGLGEKCERMTLCPEDTKAVSFLLQSLPNGVQAMSPDVPGLVETSLNLGILEAKLAGDKVEVSASFSVRSSVESEKVELIEKLEAISALAGASCSVRGDYPGWKYRVISPLRDKMIVLYREMYGSEPEVVAIHAGLECGLLMGKVEDLDCVSFGPNMRNIHTTEETLSISSAQRVWEYLVKLLQKKD